GLKLRVAHKNEGLRFCSAALQILKFVGESISIRSVAFRNAVQHINIDIRHARYLLYSADDFTQENALTKIAALESKCVQHRGADIRGDRFPQIIRQDANLGADHHQHQLSWLNQELLILIA